MDLETNVWSKAPIKLIDACRNKIRPLSKHRKKLTVLATDYLINVLNDTRLSTYDTIAEEICRKYPDSFVDIICNQKYARIIDAANI